MNEHGDRLAAIRKGCHRSLGSWLGQLDGLTGLVDIAPLFSEPIAENQGTITERPPELLPQRPHVHPFPQVDDEIGDDRLGPASAEQVDKEQDRDACDHDLVSPEHLTVRVPARKPLSGAECEHACERNGRGERRDARSAGST